MCLKQISILFALSSIIWMWISDVSTPPL
jgi:hypothetical protein